MAYLNNLTAFPLYYFAGSDYGAKLQTAINTLPGGSIIDCTNTGSISLTITQSVNITIPCTIILGAHIITATVGNGNNVFNIQSDAVSIIGVSRSSKETLINGKSRIVMTNGDYHVYAKGYNVITLKNFDCEGIQSTQYTIDGSGGILLIEPNPFISGGGNNTNQIYIDSLFVYKTKAHAIFIMGCILSQINNTRVSSAGGHGFYIGDNSTSMTLQNCYCSSATLGGFVWDGASYCSMINCSSEGSGVGIWIRGSFNISVIGCGAESNLNRTNTGLPANLGIFFDNTQASATLSITSFASLVGNTVSLTNATGTTTLVLTGVASSPGANQFIAATSNSVTAANIVTAINTNVGNTNYTATSSGSNVTVFWNTLGAGTGNTFSATAGTTPSSATTATGQILNDIGSDNQSNFFKGHSLAITGGRNAYIPNFSSTDPGNAGTVGASSFTRHILIRDNHRECYITNPRFQKSSSATGTPRFDIAIDNSVGGTPRDINIFFNPTSDGTVTPTIAGKYITQTNSAGESTVIWDGGQNTLIQSGSDKWSYESMTNRVTVADDNYTSIMSDQYIVYTSLTATRTVTLLTPPSEAKVKMTVKDESGSCTDTIKISIVAQGGKTIDGAASLDIISPRGMAQLYYNGTNWFTLNNVTKNDNNTSITVANSPYTVLSNDRLIFVDSTDGPILITLPTAVGRNGKEYIIKDSGGASTTNFITVNTASVSPAQTIDGSTSKLINFNYTSYTFRSNGSNWFIV